MYITTDTRYGNSLKKWIKSSELLIMITAYSNCWHRLHTLNLSGVNTNKWIIS